MSNDNDTKFTSSGCLKSYRQSYDEADYFDAQIVDNMIHHESELFPILVRYSIDNYNLTSSSILNPSRDQLQRKKSGLVSRSINFIKKMKWKSTADQGTMMNPDMSLLPSIQEQQYKKALHTPSRYLPQNQSILTTKSDGTILLFNDIASLCFHIDKSFIGKCLLNTLLEEPFKSQIFLILQRRHSFQFGQNNVLVCGTIIPIIKSNGMKSVASLWLKEKRAVNGEPVCIWIFEEIYDTSLSVYIDSNCIIRRVLGTMIEIYGYKEQDIVGKHIRFLVPTLHHHTWNDTLESIDRLKFFGSQTSQGLYFPVILNLNKHVAMDKDDLSDVVIKITSLPSISGAMTVSRTDKLVTSLSAVPSKHLFGYSIDEILGQHVYEFIPYLPKIIDQVDWQNDTIVSHRQCKQYLERNDIIYVNHRDKSQFEVELELKLKEADLIEVWITYDRIDAIAKYEKRKEHQEHIKKQRSLRISSFGAVEEHKKLIPSMVADLPPPSPVQSSVGGHPLDGYVILDVLGQGTYGLAKLAYKKDDPLQKKLVIKYIYKSRIIVDSWIRDRELGSVPMELHILKKLQKFPHENCCRLVTSMEDEDYYFIVMELLGNGMDLFDYIESNQEVKEKEIRHIFYQVTKAVQHLHQHQIVHRDIKDENIILDQNGSIHLIDFGCAAYFKPGKKFDTFTGTVEYCAPEILNGERYDGPPQDVWASGVLLYTLIYRENPFSTIDEIIESELKVPSVLSEDAHDLLTKMLERSVDKRITIDQVLAHAWFKNMD